jgi:hypothetical protein
MADFEGKQPVQTTAKGDVLVGVLDASSTNQVDPRDLALAGTPVDGSTPVPVAPATANTAFNVAQSTASSLNATVVQGTAANLKAEVSQGTASSLNATVVQGTAANLKTEVSQGTASSLNATVVQGTATNLKTQAEVYQGGAAVAAGAALYVQPGTGATWNVNVTGGSTTIADYDGQAAAGNGGAAVNHDVAALAQATRLSSVVCSSTTSASYYIKVDPAGGTSFVTHWVAFTSESTPTVVVDTSDYHLPLGATLRIVKLNTAKAAGSVSIHST